MPGASRDLRAQLLIAADVPERTQLDFTARMEIVDKYVSTYRASTWVSSPWLVLNKAVWPDHAQPGETGGAGFGARPGRPPGA